MCENDVEGVERSLNSFNCYSCYCTHVERVESGVCGLCTDTFNAMSKGSKDYVMLKQGTNTFLLITFLIFNDFQSKKSFGKLRLRPFQIYHPMPSMLKGSKVILTFNPFNMLRHTLHWMVWLERSKSQLSKTFFGLKIA